MAIVTLTEARRTLADMLGGYRLITTGCQTNPPAGSYVGTPNGGDAKRHIVSTDTVLLDVAGTSTPASTDLWKFAWAYVPSVPIQRQIAEQGFNGAKIASDVTDQASLTTTRVGMHTLSEPLGTALAPSLEVELHRVMPPISREQGRGLHSCINRALRNMVMRDRISVTAVANASRYSLSSYPWLMDERQLINVWDSEVNANQDPGALFRGASLRPDGEAVYLLINTYPSSTTFYVDVWRPVGSWVRVGGTWGASTAGLVNETDAVWVDGDKLAICAYYYACQALGRAWRNDPAGDYWRQQEQEYAGPVSHMLWLDRQLDFPLPRTGSTDDLTPVDTVTIGGGYSWP